MNNKGKKAPSSLKTRGLSFRERVERLVAEMQGHLESGESMNMSIPPHMEITEALHRLTYTQGKSGGLKIEYNDGTGMNKPFPVGVLWKPDGGWDWHPERVHHLHVGTLSFRHVDYDRHVDLYLIRDKETRRLIQREIEEIAYERMCKLLGASELQGESYISVYQTGLESLVIGLYRAVTEHLQHRNIAGLGPLRVRPIFYMDDETGRKNTGTTWGTGIP